METPRRRSVGFRPQTVLWLCGLMYVFTMVALYLDGRGILAAYLTMPGWLLVGGAVWVVVSLFDGAVEGLFSVYGNALVLGLSALSNVAVASCLLHVISLSKPGTKSE